MKIKEELSVYKYLKKHMFLLTQYKKVKKYLEKNEYKKILLKKRKPKILGIYQFRITKKYRGLGYFYDNETFIVTEINDHQ